MIEQDLNDWRAVILVNHLILLNLVNSLLFYHYQNPLTKAGFGHKIPLLT